MKLKGIESIETVDVSNIPESRTIGSVALEQAVKGRLKDLEEGQALEITVAGSEEKAWRLSATATKLKAMGLDAFTRNGKVYLTKEKADEESNESED